MAPEPTGFPINLGIGGAIDDKGNFEIRAVVPGSYILVAQIHDNNQPSVARVPVEVGTSNIDGLQIVVKPPVEITGRVLVEDTKINGAIFNISLQSKLPGRLGGGAVDPDR